MKLAMIGLGKMGGNMTARLIRNGISVVGYDNNQSVVNDLAQKENMIPSTSVEDALSKLDEQKIVWLMLPAGEVTEKQIQDLIPLLNDGDIIVDIKGAQARWSTLRASVNSISPGEVLELIVIRDGEEKKLEIVTKERPNTPQAL